MLAGGRGTRFGAEKQLQKIKEVPLFLYSLHIFLNSSLIRRCALTVPPEKIREYDEILESNLSAVQRQKLLLCPGGKDRADSVQAGLKALFPSGPQNEDRILVHDSARPLLRPEAFSLLLEALKDFPAAALGYPVADALKMADENGKIQKDLDRRGIWAVSTPQGFRAKELVRLLKDQAPLLYDETALFTASGLPVKIVSWPYPNLKVTYPEDLQTVMRLL